MLIYILIVFFIMLVGYQVFLALVPPLSLVEGLKNIKNITTTKNAGSQNAGSQNAGSQDYQPYNVSDPNNSLILAQQNAGNIEVLKGRIDGFDGVKEKVDTMQQSIDSMQVQMDGLVQQQADYAQELAGPTPPDVTGTDYETTENVEDSIEEEEN
jgi:hypothetical protein